MLCPVFRGKGSVLFSGGRAFYNQSLRSICNHGNLITRVSMPHPSSNLDTEICKARHPKLQPNELHCDSEATDKGVSHTPGRVHWPEVHRQTGFTHRVWLLRWNSRGRSPQSNIFWYFVSLGSRKIQNLKARVKMSIILPECSIIYIFLKGEHGWGKRSKKVHMCVCVCLLSSFTTHITQ